MGTEATTDDLSRLQDRLDTELEDGVQVTIKGDLSYYEDGGSISVIVDDAVVVGAGVYQETYEQNRELLAEGGLLDPETKQSLPELPAKVGIATSADSDAREDAVTSIHGRYPDVDIIVHNTSVQGSEAMASMMEAISVLDDNVTVDVIVLTRGGGADKHLCRLSRSHIAKLVSAQCNYTVFPQLCRRATHLNQQVGTGPICVG